MQIYTEDVMENMLSIASIFDAKKKRVIILVDGLVNQIIFLLLDKI